MQAIHFLGKRKMIYHAQMKDTVLYPENVAKWRVEFFVREERSSLGFRRVSRVGYRHGAATWKAIIQAYMDVDYGGILSIENEDPILTGEVGSRESRVRIEKCPKRDSGAAEMRRAPLLELHLGVIAKWPR